MTISVASGKGGTGKTLVSVNLAALMGAGQYADCDVEEPNGAVFLKPELTGRDEVLKPVPVIDPGRCTLCRKCSDACRYNALAVLPSRVMVYAELCHGCGLCNWICPEGAISEHGASIGTVETGRRGELGFVRGSLNVGEPMAVPIIRAVRRAISTEGDAILDAPPGTSCPVVQSVLGTDFCLMVTEPTPFGLHDLELAVAMADKLGLRTAVVVNRSDIGDDRVDRFCEAKGIPVLARIPFDRRLAEVCSTGGLVVEELPDYRPVFEKLLDEVRQLAVGEPATV